MFIKLLSKDDQKRLRDLAQLLSIADKPMLWDGKMKEEISSTTDMTKLSFKKGDAESALLNDFERETWGEDGHIGFRDDGNIQKKLLNILKEIPVLKNTEASEIRWPAVSSVLLEILGSDEDDKDDNTTLSPQAAWPFPTSNKSTSPTASCKPTQAAWPFPQVNKP